jgi:RND family efflux transporter MFP subunit
MKRMKGNKRIYWIIGLLVLVLAAGGYGLKTWLAKRSSSTSSVQTTKVTLGTISSTISGSGSVRSNQSSDISWQTSGTVATVAVQIGQDVKTGDVLATLDPTSISSGIIQAQSDLIDAQDALDKLLNPTALAIAQAETALNTAQENLNNLLNPTALAIAQADTAVQDAQLALDNLLNPTALAIAQAETAVTDAQAALDKINNPDPLAISKAETTVLTDQTVMATAQAAVDRLKYARGDQQQIDTARAAYVVAQSEVDRLQIVYSHTGGSPDKDPAKAQALSALAAAETKRDRALATLNWYTATWSASDISDRTTALALAQAQLATDQKTLDDLKTPSATTIAVAQGQVSDAQEALEKLKNPTAVDIALAQAKVSDAQKALDKLKNPTAVDIELAKQQVADAQNTLDTLKNPTADQITVAKSRVTLAEATLTQANLTAPFDGTVTNVQILPGDKVSAGKVAFHIDDLTKLYVDLSISEVDISQIKVGQEATLTFDAISSKEYTGTVTKIVMVGTVSQGVVNYPVTVQLTDGDASILSGMTAAVNVVLAKSENVLVVPNKAIHTSGTQRTVTVLFQGQQIQVPVTVGLVGDSMTEVTGNSLKEGDMVVLTGTTASTSSTTARNGFQGGFPGGDGGGVFIGP